MTVIEPAEAGTDSLTARFLRAGLATAVVDGLWAVVLTTAYGRSVMRLWQGVAATPFGANMLDGGIATAAIGVALHVVVAFVWSGVLLLIVMRSRLVRERLYAPMGVANVGAVFGPLIWIVMSLLVIPLLTQKPTLVTGRWWIQLAGHALFVGMPMAWGIAARRRGEPPDGLTTGSGRDRSPYSPQPPETEA